MEHRRTRPSGRKRRYRVLWALLAIALFLAFDLYMSNAVLQLEHISLSSARLPAAFDGFTVTQISDAHARRFGEGNSELFDMVGQTEPDIIVITGDLAEKHTELAYVRELVTGLRAIAPVYYVTGNHEWGADWTAVRLGGERFTPSLFSLLEECGAVLMDSRAETIRRGQDTVWIAGLCDPNGPASSKKIDQVLAEPRAGGDDPFILLLSHRYEMFDDYVRAGADVTMAGHAHGGMIRLPFTDGLFGPGQTLFPKRTSGLYRENRAAMVVSRGLGPTIMPRLFNRPHVVALTLHSEN